jgi:hypothetical protein
LESPTAASAVQQKEVSSSKKSVDSVLSSIKEMLFLRNVRQISEVGRSFSRSALKIADGRPERRRKLYAGISILKSRLNQHAEKCRTNLRPALFLFYIRYALL